MSTILTLTANPLLDHLATTHYEPGGVTRVDSFTRLAGGKGLNMGRVLARHGHRVLACGFAGGRDGELLSELIAADGLEPHLQRIAAPTRIGFITCDPVQGRCTSVLENGFAVSTSEIGSLLQQLRTLLLGVDLVLIAGSIPDNRCTGLYRQALDLAHLFSVPCWVDAYGPAMDEALAGVHPPLLAKPNKQEYGRSRKWVSCRELHLTDGGGEIRVRLPTGKYQVIPPRIKELNPIGSGDCYLAALAHARLSGQGVEEQLRYAAAAGTANALRTDIARIGPADILALVDGVQIKALDH